MRVILSLFRGIGLLDRAFEQEMPDACIVCGPDVIWGSDIRDFHAPAGVFWGVIGGPPCQKFSGLANLARVRGVEFENLIPEFERVVGEARPDWWLMENVVAAPVPDVPGYRSSVLVLNNRWFGEEQNRARRFTFGTRDGRALVVDVALFESPVWAHAVTAAHAGDARQRAKGRIARYSVEEATRLQGLPEGFLNRAPFTQQGKLKVIANGVPLPMGRAVAAAVRRAMAAVWRDEAPAATPCPAQCVCRHRGGGARPAVGLRRR